MPFRQPLFSTFGLRPGHSPNLQKTSFGGAKPPPHIKRQSRGEICKRYRLRMSSNGPKEFSKKSTPFYYSPFTIYDLPALDPFTFKLLISLAIVVIATVHGYGAAWLAIWM